MPADPCHTTVHTGPYTAVRSVTLALIDQRRKAERAEVRLGEPHGEGPGPREVPRTVSAVRGIGGCARTDSQGDQSRSATAPCFPLPPPSRPKPPSHPAGEGYQHRRRLAEAKVVAPAHHIASQLFPCGLKADTFGPSRDFPIRCLKRSKALGAMTRLTSEPRLKLNPRNFRSCGRATALFASFTLSLSLCMMNSVTLFITR